jgi:hypothetical protein
VGVTAPLREGVTNAWLPFPSNADVPTVEWSSTTVLTCIRAATNDADLEESDEPGELGFSPTMRRNRNTQFEFRISTRGWADIERFAR